MMAHYRKKPVIIEAVQLRLDTLEEVAQFVGDGKLADGKPEFKTEFSLDGDTTTLLIPTLEGLMTASDGDFIIRGVKGELYPCKEDIFEATYEAVTYNRE